jgi:methyl-accepting chemotaxis protein
MDETTQQNAALVEEAAAAATRLLQQAEHLHEAASIFELADEAAIAVPEAAGRGRRGASLAENSVRLPPAA